MKPDHDYPTIRARVAELDNLQEFARQHRLTLRTLKRIKSGKRSDGTEYTPSRHSLAEIAAALAKPPKKTRSSKAAKKAGQ